jgi:hypothetical protein
VIPDSNTVDFDDSWMICFWMKTKWPWGHVMSKRDPNGTGIEIVLENGYPKARFYAVDGNDFTIEGHEFVAIGQWIFVSLAYDSGGDIGLNGDPNRTGNFVAQTSNANPNFVYSDVDFFIPVTHNFNNDANLVFGGNQLMPFYGALCNFSYYSTCPTSLGYYCIEADGRTGGNMTGWVPAFTCRFWINEGAGDNVYNTTNTINGVLSDIYFQWTNENSVVDDTPSVRRRLRNIDGQNFIFNSRKKRN